MAGLIVETHHIVVEAYLLRSKQTDHCNEEDAAYQPFILFVRISIYFLDDA